jgi:flavin-dependent dehydrogenase
MGRLYDVVIAGAGPVGLYLAGLLEKEFNVLVLEADKMIGSPNHCSGLISKRLDGFVRVPEDCVEHEVSGCFLRSPSGIEALLEKDGTAAYVLDREKFDRHMAGLVSSDILTGRRLEGFSVRPDGVSVRTNKGVFRSQILAGCDGADSAVSRLAGNPPRKALKGIMFIKDSDDFSPNVGLFFDKRFCRDGFLWKIPRGHGVEYGMMSSSAGFRTLEQFFGPAGKAARRRGGLIPMGRCRSAFDRVILAGDAAMQVKPWSGGGVVFGMTCARFAAETISAAFEAGDFSGGVLAEYEKKCTGAVGRRISAGLFLRRVYCRMGNMEIDAAVGAAKLASPILKRLDMDFFL